VKKASTLWNCIKARNEACWRPLSFDRDNSDIGKEHVIMSEHIDDWPPPSGSLDQKHVAQRPSFRARAAARLKRWKNAVWAMEEKDWATAIITAVLAAGATFGTKWMELSSQEVQKAREVNTKVLETALSVLSQDSEKLDPLRGWAVDVVNKAAPVQIPKEAREQLMRAPSPRPKEQNVNKAAAPVMIPPEAREVMRAPLPGPKEQKKGP
jgi:hypothetical protein